MPDFGSIQKWGAICELDIRAVITLRMMSDSVRPGLAARTDFETVFLGRLRGPACIRSGVRTCRRFGRRRRPLDQAVVECLEISETIEFGDARPHLIDTEGFTDQRLHFRHDGLFVAFRFLVDADELDGGQSGHSRLPPRLVRVIVGFADAQARELFRRTACRLLAADEIFLSASIREVMPVVAVDAVELARGAAAAALQTALRAAAGYPAGQ